MHPKNELEVFFFFFNIAFIWYRVSLFMIYDVQFHSCEHIQYLGPLKATSTTINLGFHCQVQDYLGFLRLNLFFIII